GILDIDTGEIVRPGIVHVEGDRIVGLGGEAPSGSEVLALGDVVLLPGFMDMEVNLLMGGRGETGLSSSVEDDPALRMLRTVRKAVRYEINYGAQVIKICVSGGIMSMTGSPGAQHYSDEELRAIVDEAHRRGLKVAAHTHGAEAVRHAVDCGIDCIEHGFLID